MAARKRNLAQPARKPAGKKPRPRQTSGEFVVIRGPVNAAAQRTVEPSSPASAAVTEVPTSAAEPVVRPGIRPAHLVRTGLKKWTSLALLLFLFGAWAVAFRPRTLGGPATYVTVSGTSMAPHLDSGDLVIVRPKRTYRVGDLVAYRVPAGEPASGFLVVHRIVGGTGSGGFITKGDNASSVDVWRPRTKDVLGTRWIVVAGGGRILSVLRAPLPLASIATALTVYALLGSSRLKRVTETANV